MQISEFLVREIAAGRLIDGERLPPERDMAQQLGTSVGTLRKALKTLEDDKLLERIQGSGNYIRTGGPTDAVYAMFRLEVPEGGGLPSAELLSLDHMAKLPDLPDFGTSARATRLRRLRFLNGQPVAVEEIWLDGSAGDLEPDMVSESLYRTYRLRLDLWIDRAEDRVGLAPVPDWAPDAFGPSHGERVGYVERFAWAADAAPVEYSRTWFDPDRAVYVQRLR